jgi:hypothetical protein
MWALADLSVPGSERIVNAGCEVANIGHLNW